jgi:hydrogenase maturation factor
MSDARAIDRCDAEGHCITCSDEALAMRVLEASDEGVALCAGEDGAPAEVMVDLIGDVSPGDMVLVHAGVALTLTGEARP